MIGMPFTVGDDTKCRGNLNLRNLLARLNSSESARFAVHGLSAQLLKVKPGPRRHLLAFLRDGSWRRWEFGSAPKFEYGFYKGNQFFKRAWLYKVGVYSQSESGSDVARIA
jgi:hypothetical protein